MGQSLKDNNSRVLSDLYVGKREICVRVCGYWIQNITKNTKT